MHNQPISHTRRALRYSPAVAAALMAASALSTGAVAQEADDPAIDVIVVEGIARSFLPKDTSSVARFDIPLEDTPASVAVLTEDLLELANIGDVGEALSLVSGVSFGGRNFSQPQYNYRGFEGGVEGSINVDNYRSSNFFLPDRALIDRIDIIKGPVAVNYGEIQPGGTINLVTKRPDAGGGTKVKAQIGKWNQYRFEFDSTGAVAGNEDLLYRVIAAYEDSENFVDFVEDEVIVFGGSLDWQATDKLSFAAKYINQTRDARFDVGGVVDVNTTTAEPTFTNPDVPRSTFYGQPWNSTKADFINYGLEASYALTDRWTLNAIYDYQEVERYNLFAQANGPTVNGSQTVGQRRREDREGLTELSNYEVNLVGDFEWFGQEHTFYVGVQHFDVNEDDVNRVRVNLDPFNIFNPVYQSEDATGRGDAPLDDYNVTEADTTSIAAQVYLNLTDRFSVLLGGRFSDQESVTTRFECDRSDVLAGATGECADTSFGISDLVPSVFVLPERAEEEAFTPTVGLVFAATDNINTYFNYSRSFEAQTAPTVSLDPSEGEQFEIGVKGLFFDNRLSVTSAIYHITKTNIALEDDDNPGTIIVQPEQTSQGFDLDIVGEVAAGWNVIAQYGYVDAETDEDLGLKPPRVPEHSGSIFTTYEIQSGKFAGLGFGTGYRYVGEREANVSNRFTQDSYQTLDVQIFYNGFENVELLASGSNIFDEEYYDVTFNGSPNGVRPGKPSAWRLSAAYRF